jgi:hypothetical protein
VPWSRLPAKAGALISLLLMSSAALILPQSYSNVSRAADDPDYFAATGFTIADPIIGTYFRQHGGVAAVGFPISGAITLLGSRVQIFQRGAIEERPDGSVGMLDLVDGNFLPLSAIGGAGMAPDPVVVAKIPAAGPRSYSQLASALLDSSAPNDWNGMSVRFGATYRSMVKCTDLVGVKPCDGGVLFSTTNDVFGLPTGRPIVDPHNQDFVYLRFQRGVMVYSHAANRTQWLLLGELFKQILQGKPLPQELLAQIKSSPTYSRFYAQYDPNARDSIARPSELPRTTLGGAFESAEPAAPTATKSTGSAPSETDAGQTAASVANAPAPNAPTVSAPTVSAPASSARPQLDPRFGVAQGFENPGLMAELHAGWERIVLPWDQIQPKGPGDFSQLGLTVSTDKVRAEVARGIHLAAVLQFTPNWAQANPAAGQRSVPKNLNLPFDDPQNYWGQFVYQTVRAYSGAVDDFIIWNEPDFRASDPGGSAYTWAGTDAEFARLLAVGYMAAKKANPNAVVSFPATSYWVEELSTPKRTPFYERLLRILTADPTAAANNYYHDAVSLNLYRSPDDVYRVHSVFDAIQKRYGIQRPVWLTELNAMPTDDGLIPCADHQAASPFKTTLDQQAAFGLQSFALAAAAGYQHAEFYSMVDDDTCQEPAWGLVRADGSRRPVADAVRTAFTFFSQFTSARFVPLARPQEAWPSWPNNPGSYLPNWQVYQVAFDRPGSQRVTALWNGDGAPLRVRIPKNGSSARLVDKRGLEHPVLEQGGAWVIDLAPSTLSSQDDGIKDPDGYHVIGGDPVLIVEQGVDASDPVVAPALS